VTVRAASRRGGVALLRVRWAGAIVAVAALSALLTIGPPGNARAVAATGTGYDQITGAGSTDSAVTVLWKQGLLDSSNQPLTADNAVRSDPGSSPLAFMYEDPDFQNLQVTVSQTQNITHQGITVSWQGSLETARVGGGSSGALAGDYLQMMECYGSSSSGPSPEDCEYGTQSQLGGSTASLSGTRSGDLCAIDPTTGQTAAASTANPPRGLDGSGAAFGCDPEEPVQGASPADVNPANPDDYTIPFVPEGGCASGATGCPAYSVSDTNQYFNQFETNEVEGALTGQGGTGQLQFETLTSTQAPALGCGQLNSSGQPQGCWLVIVPRGEYEPNGFCTVITSGPNSCVGTGGDMVSSPLSASNWAMRIQIYLAYAPLQPFCPIGTQETETVGTQLIGRAVQSWQLALNQTSNCARIYGYSAVPEATSTQQLQTGSVGLAFTTIPIGSEAARDGESPPTGLPPIVYAPVAVTAVGFGFNISVPAGYITTPVNLSPELLAKALTQVYLSDLPDYYPNPTTAGILPQLGPAAPGQWASPNPQNISYDGQFQRLNPDSAIWDFAVTTALAPMLTEDHSALNQQIWEWIQSDPGAVAWLNAGTHDNANFDTETADPDYTALQLGTAPAIDSFPRAYSNCLNAGTDPTTDKEITRCSLDLLPYVNNYDQAAANIVVGYNPVITIWDSQALAPDGSNGWWDVQPPEPIGARWLWGISDTADLAAYGLIDAQLCSDSGSGCVGPSTASLTTALDSATPDSAGLLQVNPASPGDGGYPLTQVVYAAVATNQSAADLSADADLIAYAAGAGQTPGAASGELPPGYLPMPASLQAQATAVVATLRADASAATGTSSGSSSGSSTGSSSGSGGHASAGVSPSAGGQLTPTSGTSSPSAFIVSRPSAVLASTRTPRQPVGPVRWALLVVVITGAACAAGGTVLRSANPARWLRRLRP
jgi:hypothetical protein